MKTGVKVGDIMTKKPVTIDRSTSLKKCAEVMRERDINSLIVKNDVNRVLGVVVDEDFVRKAIAKNMDCEHVEVGEIMSREVIKIEPERDIYDAIKLMGDNNIRQLPVVDGHKLLGLVTIKDIQKIEPALFEILSERIMLRKGGNR